MPRILTSILEALRPSALQTSGPSPKVTLPAALLALTGAGLLIAGVATGDSSLTTYGLIVLGASGVTATAGAAAAPGTVVPTPLGKLGGYAESGDGEAARLAETTGTDKAPPGV